MPEARKENEQTSDFERNLHHHAITKTRFIHLCLTMTI